MSGAEALFVFLWNITQKRITFDRHEKGGRNEGVYLSAAKNKILELSGSGASLEALMEAKLEAETKQVLVGDKTKATEAMATKTEEFALAADFKALSSIWEHSILSQAWKYRIFQACVLSKLLYGLQTAWLTKKQRDK